MRTSRRLPETAADPLSWWVGQAHSPAGVGDGWASCKNYMGGKKDIWVIRKEKRCEED